MTMKTLFTRPVFSPYEMQAMTQNPDILEALADHHSVRETMADASDYKESADVHAARRLELTRLAAYIRLCHENDHEPEFGIDPGRIYCHLLPGEKSSSGLDKMKVLKQWLRPGDIVRSLVKPSREGFILDTSALDSGSVTVQWMDKEYLTHGNRGDAHSVHSLIYAVSLTHYRWDRGRDQMDNFLAVTSVLPNPDL